MRLKFLRVAQREAPLFKELVMEVSNIVLVLVGVGAVAANGFLPVAAHKISGIFGRGRARGSH